MFFTAEKAGEIPLEVWQDPQGDVVLHTSREDCQVFFGCWKAPGEPADYLGQLTFEHAWAIQGFHLELTPYVLKEPRFKSSILVIENSRWLKQVTDQRLQAYPRWKDWDKRVYKHFVVSGHDNYYDIAATEFAESTVPLSEAGELKRLILDA